MFLDLKPPHTETMVNDIVAATLFEGDGDCETTMRVKRFLATNRDDVPTEYITMSDVVKYLRKTIVIERLELVKREDIGTGVGKTHPAWNIYIRPPTTKFDGLREWRDIIQRTSFITLSFSAGTTYRTFRCTVCRSENHPTGMCRYPDQVGWVKPSPPASAALEDTPSPTTTTQGGPSTSRGGRGAPNNGRGRPGMRGRGRGTQRA